MIQYKWADLLIFFSQVGALKKISTCFNNDEKFSYTAI
ncbi:hypothetical protein AS4_14170 [Acinetobacter guillouiae]|nr:hypothetical protein AS4_14170 [Acinetobacter guillouiae]